jgi:hypothetical protein
MTRPDASALHLSSGLLIGAVSAALSLIGALTRSPETAIFATVLLVPAVLLTIIGVYRLATAVDHIARNTADTKARENTPA